MKKKRKFSRVLEVGNISCCQAEVINKKKSNTHLPSVKKKKTPARGILPFGPIREALSKALRLLDESKPGQIL